MNFKKCVIFGGAGFIGEHCIKFLLDHKIAEEIYVADINPIKESTGLLDEPRVKIQTIDVRTPDQTWNLPTFVDLIINLAAIHREPGHLNDEYFETNLNGATNICNWARKVECKTLIFTSSISTYGPCEVEKDENSIPTPVTAYGSSKLVAEKIHEIWWTEDRTNRHLVIVRPGVVFGPREGGNVSRLIQSLLHRYFVYTGNHSTRKAGVYVKELCNAIFWVLYRQYETGENFILFNMTMNPGPSVKEFVDAILKVSENKYFVPSIPHKILLIIAHIIDFFSKFFGIKHPFSPVRIHKLVRSNNIAPKYLINSGYTYLYSLDTALQDWKSICPEEWRVNTPLDN